MKSVINKTGENSSFTISTPSYWTPNGGEKTINELNEIPDLRSQKNVKLNVKEFEKEAPE